MSHEARPSRLRLGESLGLIGVLGAIILLFGFTGRHFFSTATFQQIANQVPALTVLAVGMTFVILTGGIDLNITQNVTLGCNVNYVFLPDGVTFDALQALTLLYLRF